MQRNYHVSIIKVIYQEILRTWLSLVKQSLACAVHEKQHQHIKYHDQKGVKSREEKWVLGVIMEKKEEHILKL